MNSSKTTPMIKQYLSIKQAYADAILFYRMGDFYEMFFEDAEVASKLLEITLTSRNKKDDRPIPMCGVPVRAVQGYIVRLIEKGYKVAICEQTEDPAIAKGIVKREVVRVITPGMIVDDEYLDEKSNNYILALAQADDVFGISFLDISTGTFRIAESPDIQTIVEECLRISPSEILLPETLKNDSSVFLLVEGLAERSVNYLEERIFNYRTGREKLLEQFRTLSLEGFGCENLKAGVGAAGAILFYVRETQKQPISHLTKIENYNLSRFLMIDEISCRNLELLHNIRTGTRKGTLLGVLDRTVTAMGARLLKQWLRYPLTDMDDIRFRLDAVEETKTNISVRHDVRESLKSVYDLERLGAKISMGHANARDLLALKRSLQTLPVLWSLLSQLKSEAIQFNENISDLDELGALIERAIREDAPPVIHEGGMIEPGYCGQLDELIKISRDGKSWLANLEVKEKKTAGINSLKVRYNKVFGYYIEVPKSQSASVPAHYVRKQTLVNAERYITDELKNFENEVLGAEERRATLEHELFQEIREVVVRHNPLVQRVAHFIARLDCLVNLAEVADQEGYHRPDIATDGTIRIEDGRHPVVEKMLTGERFVPNSIQMDDDENQILIITGPNMAGKSTALRQVALLVLMAQMGSFIPASRVSISMTDRIFTRVGALDNLSQGQSTFMVEMQETANILNNATDKSLVILDEIGRGTSTFDGLSIAWAVAEYLHDLNGKGVKTLFATHYHELTNLADTKPRVKNYNIAVKEWSDQIIFLRKLVEGGTNRSYGIQVSRLAGIPDEVIQRAKRILFNIENGEHSLHRSEFFTTAGSAPEAAGPVQLALFRRPDQALIEKIQTLDISTMTPLDALNVLSELQEKAKDMPLSK
jgi:DNA mismatch repair protein MutS